MGFDVDKYTIPHGWYGSHTPIIHINSHGFRLTKPEPGPSTPGQALLGCVSDDPYLFRSLRACGATSSSVVLRDTNSFPAVGFSKKWGYRGYHCVYIYILYFFFTCMHTWNICTRKADGTGWNIQFQLVVFFELLNHLNPPWVNFHQGWIDPKKSGLRKTGSEIPVKECGHDSMDFLQTSWLLRFGKDLPQVPRFFFLESSNHNPNGALDLYTSLGGEIPKFSRFQGSIGLNEWKKHQPFKQLESFC